MRYTHILFSIMVLCSGLTMPSIAQNTNCGPEEVADPDGFSGTAFFNYGSQARSKSQNYRTSVAVGQTFVGLLESGQHVTTVGFYSRFLLPPFALKVAATQGDLLDRIQVSWEIDALGPSPNDGFNIYRDDVFLATVGPNIRNYNDFNVIPGKPYVYSVRGLNIYGEGVSSTALGFQVPNGVVTGWVQTLNGSPVPDALVTLTPMQGFSAKFGTLDGAFALADAAQNPFLPTAGQDWTMTFWVKTDMAAANASLIKLSPSLYIRALNSGSGNEGIEVATSPGSPFLSATFDSGTKNDWHHVALTFEGSGGQGRLYVDGVLAALAPMGTVPSADSLNIGNQAGSGGWVGRLDELRIYHHLLDELDFRDVMEGTASSQTPFLAHYWKMDEELGVKSYDLIKRHKLYFCGAKFDADRPPVRTAGKTNADGFYSIESASYGTGTTFLAKPKKDFYMHRALKMKRSEGDFATLPDFSITPKATIELWVNSAGPDGTQCLLSKKWGSNEFRLMLQPNGLNNELFVFLNGTQTSFGILGNGYQHLAFTWNGTTGVLAGYKNGVLLNTSTFSGVTGNWSDPAEEWVLGARKNGAAKTDFFGGLMDEVAVYDTTLSAAAILGHFQNTRDMQEKGLRVYFPLDEGSGINLSNSGSAFLDSGANFGADWSAFAANQVDTPHIFTPATRQVTLNPSVTSVDQVDFIDRSTVAVSGYVRYKDTDCFAKNVEILVNGASFSPQVFTDSLGKFVIDFDPGTTAKLTPVFEDHVFIPAFWDVTNVNSPIAGILFNDITTRKISGQVAGGFCKKSIIKLVPPPNQGQSTVCVVKVRTSDGCLERIITIDNQEGEFEFDNLPPIENMTVAVVEHSNPLIKTAFQVQGGSTVNLTQRDSSLDFLYFAPPQVEIVSGLDPYSPTCDFIVLEQYDLVEMGIKLKEQYEDGVCYIDSASFHIFNGFGDSIIDTTMSNGLLTYKFEVGVPNPTPPYLKTLQIVSTTLDGNDGEYTTQGLVTGIRNKDNTFTSLMPEIPTLILRDPPGDGSYSYLEKNEKICKQTMVTGDLEIGGGGSIEVHLGTKKKVVTAPLGIGTINDFQVTLDNNTAFELSYQKITSNSFETCTSFSSRISTNANDLIVGGYQGGDVYMGEAINIVFGFADKITFDDNTCSPVLQVVLNVEPGDFSTTFMYSEWSILNNTMRYLDSLILYSNAEPETLAKYVESKNRWQTILDNNKSQKEQAEFVRNISFDAGITYEYAETSDTSRIDEEQVLLNSDVSNELRIGFTSDELGLTGGLNFFSRTSNGGKDVNGNSTGIKTGYFLADDNPLDAFTMDVAMDSVYKTPVFRLTAGQSSCPWEFGTAKREGVLLTSVDGPTRTDVPANEPAVYNFLLGNVSATNETFTYSFSAGPESNPHGAKIFLNGAALDHPVFYAIPYGTSVPATITLERGPVEYDYEDLEIVLYSLCEDSRANELGILPDTAQNLYSAVYIGAHFIRPCSEVAINVPEQDWVLFPDPLTPGPDDIRRITVSGYDTTEVDFQLVRVQYRRSDGDGAWINIPGISDRYNPMWSGFAALPLPKPPTLLQDFTQFFWNTEGLSDGPYEIRAVTVCTGDASDKPGYSQIIKGRIDRQPPSLVGLPQPSDGVYQVGDEISFTFNQDVNCTQLIQADIFNDNNVGLYDATTNTLIDANITCVGNKIVIDPLFQNEFYENHILRAELHNIQDLTGNVLIGTEWEFYVDRNELAWLTDSIGITKYTDENKTIVAKIHNRGGYPVPFTMQDVPAWVHVTPNTGTLMPNEIRDIQFTVDSTVALGVYADSIILHTETGQNPFFMGGDEGLPLGVRVICRPPNWNINPADFQLTMNMNLKLIIGGVESTDPEDQVGVFIAGQLRGTAKPVYVPAFGYWVAFVTVYGNTTDEGKPLVFEIFDASACLHHPGTFTGSYIFASNSIIGTAAIPALLNTSSLLLREIPLKTGWNWISFNLGFANPATNTVLANISNPVNDLIKDQTKFSTFSNGTWSGAMNTITNKSLYLYQAAQPNTLKITGTPLTPASVPIPVVVGWNWIGYVPNYKLPVNTALATLPAQQGDLIKSQTAFAQFVNGSTGWVGSLTELNPLKGYMLKMTQAGTLTYPPQITSPDEIEERGTGPVATFWTVDPSQFEHNMTLIGMFQANGINATIETMELGAFVGDEIRGVAQAVYIEALHSYMFFLTSYANLSGEQLQFKLFDAATGAVQSLEETMSFSPNLHQGSIEQPLPFTLESATGTTEVSSEESFEIRPNPFQGETVFRIVLSDAQDISLSITDVSGKEVSNVQALAQVGLNTIKWDGLSSSGSPLNSGVYFVRLKTEQGTTTKKVVMQR